MPKFATAVCFIALAGLTGCSSTMRTYVNTLQLAFNPGADVSLSPAQLANRQHDALYATVGGLPRAVLGLAFVEHGQQKWQSADNAMLVLEQGRLVKTTGFANDLLYLAATADDPLKQPMTAIQPGQQWQCGPRTHPGRAQPGRAALLRAGHPDLPARRAGREDQGAVRAGGVDGAALRRLHQLPRGPVQGRRGNP